MLCCTMEECTRLAFSSGYGYIARKVKREGKTNEDTSMAEEKKKQKTLINDKSAEVYKLKDRLADEMIKQERNDEILRYKDDLRILDRSYKELLSEMSSREKLKLCEEKKEQRSCKKKK